MDFIKPFAAFRFCVRDSSGIGCAFCCQLERIARPAARPGTPKGVLSIGMLPVLAMGARVYSAGVFALLITIIAVTSLGIMLARVSVG